MLTVLTPLAKNEQSASRDALRAIKKVRRCILELKTEMREFHLALDIFELVPVKETIRLTTNGEILFFSPLVIISQNDSELKKEILHIVFHCLLGHLDSGNKAVDQELAWAVMDLKVKRLMMLYGVERDEVFKNRDRDIYGMLVSRTPRSDQKESIGMELYYRAKKNKKLRERVIKSAKEAVSDDHSAWQIKRVKSPLLRSKNGKKIAWGEAADSVKDSYSCKSGITDGDFDDLLEALLENKSKENSRKNIPGNGSLSRAKSVMDPGERHTDYRDILSLLRQKGITESIDDYPDPILYTYGMELYDDVLLVEPSEDAEKQVIDTIAVAVDTSGSCEDRLDVFFGETCELFKRLLAEYEVKKVLYLECDDRIQNEILLEKDEIARFFEEKHSFKGCGGTDFRPVFEKLEKYNRENGNVACLIYYSDGMGHFPVKSSDYPSFYVLPDRSRLAEKYIPEWVERMYL